MGYAYGQNNNGREIGYGVTATCDFPGCETEIDRGLDYCCGGIDGTSNAGMDETPYCGGFFCHSHLFTFNLCETCRHKTDCQTCEGMGELTQEHDWDTLECPDCDGLGYINHG